MKDLTVKEITWNQVHKTINEFARKIMQERIPVDAIVAVSRGGIIPGALLKEELDLFKPVGTPLKVIDPFIDGSLKGLAGKNIILIDDIYDTGTTVRFFEEEAVRHKVTMMQLFIVDKRKADFDVKNSWCYFPWETELDEVGGRRQAVVALLRSIKEDPLREGLRDTPSRVDRMWNELTAGYQQKPEEILKATFASEEYDEMIILSDIEFFSTCEHHLLPFYGKVHFGYLPEKHIVGISKLARLVDCFSRRLQIQERMTMQIGKAFEEVVKPKGVAVIVEGLHLCMMLRGIKKRNTLMKTSYLSGPFREKAEAREEFLRLVKK